MMALEAPDNSNRRFINIYFFLFNMITEKIRKLEHKLKKYMYPLLVEKISIDQLPNQEEIEIGKEVEVIGPNGMGSPGWIRLIEEDFVLVDMNPHLAGKTLKFKIKLIETGLEPDPIVNPFTFGHECDCGHDH